MLARCEKYQTYEDAKERALKGLQEEVSKGVQFIRTHIDMDHSKLKGLKAMLDIRQKLKDNVTIQIVVFPQEGMYAYKGGAEMVEEALKRGPTAWAVFVTSNGLVKSGKNPFTRPLSWPSSMTNVIDGHCDETDDVMSRFVELLNALVMAKALAPLPLPAILVRSVLRITLMLSA